MKKLFIAALALASVVACSKDDNASVLDSSKKSVSITIENMKMDSRAVTDTAVGQTDLRCTKAEDLVFVFCDQSWKKVVAKAVADAEEINGVYTFHALPQTVANVFVIANGDVSENAKLTTANAPASKDAAETLWIDEKTDVEWKEVIVYGAASDFARAKNEDGSDAFCGKDTKYPLFSASVKVVPAHARMEVTNVDCDDLGKNEYGYTKITLGTLTLADKYTQPINQQLDSTLDTPVRSANAGNGKVWSWNIKEQNKSNLVLALTVDEGKNWTIPAGTKNRTVTVVDYEAPDDYANTDNVENGKLKKFVPGEIYTLDLSFDEKNIDNDQDYICVNVKVVIAEWVIVPVTPVFGNN